MILFLYFITFFQIYLNERALPSYKMDVGQEPVWLATPQLKKQAAVERWYIDETDAICKPFTYLGSLGNFNNFVSRAACNEHLRFKPEEQADSCLKEMKEGDCKLAGDNRLTRWYFKRGPHAGKTNACHSFKYNGCGGNANNFETQLECEEACQNKENGQVDSSADNGTLKSVPNRFDCKFVPEVKTASPIMGIVPHKDGKKCVYAAIYKDAKRGFFNHLPTCVKTCIKPLVDACAAEGPHQVELTEDLTNNNDATVYYYFNKKTELCLPFMSKTVVAGKTNIDDGALNIFSSVEICASFCPAIGHIGEHTAVEACTLPKSGATVGNDRYKITRYFYNNSASPKACEQFSFSGKDMNLNNFKSTDDCEKICKEPLGNS